MRNVLGVFLLFMVIVSCGLFQKPETDSNIKTVNLHCTVHKPYCGGARPSPDVAAGYYESMKFEKFKLIKGTTFTEGMTIFSEIGLDEGGNAILQLEPGDYMLVRSDKFLGLEAFKKENGLIEETNYRLKGDDCFIQWKNTVDLYFTVVNDTMIELRQKAKCWVGTNPCVEYIGPPAP